MVAPPPGLLEDFLDHTAQPIIVAMFFGTLACARAYLRGTRSQLVPWAITLFLYSAFRLPWLFRVLFHRDPLWFLLPLAVFFILFYATFGYMIGRSLVETITARARNAAAQPAA